MFAVLGFVGKKLTVRRRRRPKLQLYSYCVFRDPCPSIRAADRDSLHVFFKKLTTRSGEFALFWPGEVEGLFAVVGVDMAVEEGAVASSAEFVT